LWGWAPNDNCKWQKSLSATFAQAKICSVVKSRVAVEGSREVLLPCR
jgi:hypothetical protein